MLPERPAVRESQVLDVGAPRIACLHDAEEPGPGAPAGGHERLDRVAAQVGIDGQSIDRGLEPAALLQIRVRICARGGADVAPLPVGDDQ